MLTEEKLYATDTSQALRQFLGQQQLDMHIKLTCGLSMEPLREPVRHLSLQRNLCAIELKYFLEYVMYSGWTEKQQLSCPLCLQKKDITYYGIDRFTLNMIELLKLQGQQVPNEIIYKSSNGKFYSGQIEVAGLHPLKSNIQVQSQLETIPKHQLDGLDKIMKNIKAQFGLQGLIFERAARRFNLQSSQLLMERLNRAKSELLPILEANVSLNTIGEENYTADRQKFCFGFFNIYESSQTNRFEPSLLRENILVIYFPLLKVWKEFKLSLDNRPFRLNIECLCIKEITDNQATIFILGGYQQSYQQALDDFYSISFSLDQNLENITELKVQKLPPLPYKCLGPQGFAHQSKVYLWGGFTYDQRKMIVQTKLCIYENKKWTAQNQVQFEKRIDGSIYVDYQKKYVMIFGGYQQKPSVGKDDKDQEMIKTSEIFNYAQLQKKTISIEFGCCDQRILANKALIASVDSKQFLLLGARFLGVNLRQSNFKPIISQLSIVQSPPIITLAKHDFTYNCNYIMDRIENQIILSASQKDNKEGQNFRDIFSFLIHDYEGVFLNNQFYTVYNMIEDIKKANIRKVKVVAYNYNITNGSNQFIPFNTTKQANNLELVLRNYVCGQKSQEHLFSDLRSKRFQQIQEENSIQQKRWKQEEEIRKEEEERRKQEEKERMRQEQEYKKQEDERRKQEEESRKQEQERTERQEEHLRQEQKRFEAEQKRIQQYQIEQQEERQRQAILASQFNSQQIQSQSVQMQFIPNQTQPNQTSSNQPLQQFQSVNRKSNIRIIQQSQSMIQQPSNQPEEVPKRKKKIQIIDS